MLLWLSLVLPPSNLDEDGTLPRITNLFRFVVIGYVLSLPRFGFFFLDEGVAFKGEKKECRQTKISQNVAFSAK